MHFIFEFLFAIVVDIATVFYVYKIFHTPGMILGEPLKDGYDSHMSPCRKELVIFHSDRILPCYVVHYAANASEFRYRVGFLKALTSS